MTGWKRATPVIQLDDSQLRLSVKTAQASLDAARINLSTGQDTTKQANPRLDLQVRSAESALSAAQRNYDARKALFALGGATSGDVDRAKSDLDMAQANLEAARTALDQNQKADVQDIAQLKLAVDQADFALQQAQLNLQHAAIKAPYAGRLVAVNVMPGELVSQSAPAFILASREREVDFDVPPADAASLPVGAPVNFTLNGSDHPLKVSQSPEVPLNGVVPIVAAVPASLPLSFGAIGTVSYSLSLAHGTIIPTGALQTNEDKNFVYVVEGGKGACPPDHHPCGERQQRRGDRGGCRQHRRGEPAAGPPRRLDREDTWRRGQRKAPNEDHSRAPGKDIRQDQSRGQILGDTLRVRHRRVRRDLRLRPDLGPEPRVSTSSPPSISRTSSSPPRTREPHRA